MKLRARNPSYYARRSAFIALNKQTMNDASITNAVSKMFNRDRSRNIHNSVIREVEKELRDNHDPKI